MIKSDVNHNGVTALFVQLLRKSCAKSQKINFTKYSLSESEFLLLITAQYLFLICLDVLTSKCLNKNMLMYTNFSNHSKQSFFNMALTGRVFYYSYTILDSPPGPPEGPVKLEIFDGHYQLSWKPPRDAKNDVEYLVEMEYEPNLWMIIGKYHRILTNVV